MREIKFRAKEIGSEGKWRVGDLHTTAIKPHIHSLSNKYLIKIETIGQFTGLHDSIGREIYEGDIIRSFDSKGEPIIHYLLYDNEEAGFVAILKGSAKGDFGYGRCYQQWITECEKEVVGNIHDNAELLKGK
jgi:uncharacterized phage protein (TIGR01671 family)